MLNIILNSVEPGLIYGIGAIGLAITYRFLGFPDFTVFGAVVAGAIVAIAVTRIYGHIWGIGAGFATGAFLGCVTGFLATAMHIKPVLAGIITYTASFTLSFCVCTDGSYIEIPDEATVLLLAPKTSFTDITILGVINFVICAGLAFLMKTKIGLLVLAMSGNPRFLEFRHRMYKITFVSTTAIGNGLVGLAGALYAMNDRSADVYSHIEFLPLALGGIFAAAATVKLLSRFAEDRIPIIRFEREDLSDATGEISATERYSTALAQAIFLRRDSFLRHMTIFLSYSVACCFFTIISRSVHSKALDNEWFEVTWRWQFAVVAGLLAICVWVASRPQTSGGN